MAKKDKNAHVSETPATQMLKAHKVEFSEHPYEYVCVRGATALGATAHGPTGILSVLDEGFFEDPDPDGALVSAVRDGLAELAPGTERP